jgi:hypothetical protein
MSQVQLDFQTRQVQLPDVEAWLRAHSEQMHVCPRLPGQARITKAACLKRRSLALEINNRNGNESLFDGGGPVGINTCLGCDKGAELAGEGRAPLSLS